MWLIGGVLIFLAIKKEMEPALLLPIGFGAILVNIPLSNVLTSYECQTCHKVYSSLVKTCEKCGGTLFAPAETGIIEWLYEIGIEASEALPILLFIGIGAMIDFEPLIVNPKLMILGAFAQLGIFLTIILAVLCNFHTRRENARQRLSRSDSSRGVLVHGARSDYTTCRNQVHYEQKRTPYPYGIQRQKSKQNR